MSDLSKEQKLKHLQLALSMVGVSANLMTCELIQAMSEKVDEKGLDFSLRDANELAESIKQKYDAINSQNNKPPIKKGIEDASIVE